MDKSFGICFNKNIDNYFDIVTSLENILSSHKFNYQTFDMNELKPDCDFVFVVGGDGTILKAARFYSKLETPIFGVNVGHLGFLSQVSKGDLVKSVEKILAGDYKIERRMMLQSGDYLALNDFVVKGEFSSRTSRFSLQIDSKHVCEYSADGIIISTPTGSTAYGMAAGGPILSPQLDAIVIVPICPHSFSARPIVVSGESEIKIGVRNNNSYVVSADGQDVFCSDKDILIKKSDFVANLALLKTNDFYTILRDKLYWSVLPAYDKKN